MHTPDKTEADNRVRSLTVQCEIMQAKRDKCIPPESLRKAQGLVVRDCAKGGFSVAYQGSRGLATAKDPKMKTRRAQARSWSCG